MVHVKAPADLVEGFQFSAEVDGKVIPVAVPAGGVKKGQVFYAPVSDKPDDLQVPLLNSAESIKSRSITTSTEHIDGSHSFESRIETSDGGIVLETKQDFPPGTFGAWRRGLCGWFDFCCWHGAWWMSLSCCCGCLLGQVMQRLGLDWMGRPTSDPSNTCRTVSVIVYVLIFIYVVLFMSFQLATAYYYAPSTLLIILYQLSALSLFVIFFMHAFARNAVRRRYHIPPNCMGALGDFLCAYWCGACSLVQIIRHTQHDDNSYVFNSPTGLRSDAPAVMGAEEPMTV